MLYAVKGNVCPLAHRETHNMRKRQTNDETNAAYNYIQGYSSHIQTTRTHTHTHTLSLSHPYTHSCTHNFTHVLTLAHTPTHTHSSALIHTHPPVHITFPTFSRNIDGRLLI